MAELPFDIPASLASYLEQYDSAPEKTTNRLEKQLQKRGADAVGHLVLAWFYHQQEKHQQAVDAALKAKLFAPGSPFFERLHYFFSHPQLFNAWCNHKDSAGSTTNAYDFSQTGPILDLDQLIKKLSKVESTRIKFNPDAPSGDSSPASDESDNIDDIVSETLANIHEQQGKIDEAINVYQRLKVNNKEKKTFYNKQIKRLKKIQDQQEKDNS
ncbi:MAG: hypothetical protein JXR26_11430 [Balneolaceae bacterium]|nr:hypothetical protein [Balneolaceae bacterium]